MRVKTKIIKLLNLIYLLVVFEVNAQWSHTDGPPSSRINQSLATNGLYIFSGTNGGMVRSTTGGGNWLNIDYGLTSTDINKVEYFTDFPNQSGSLFACSEKIFWSTNYGDSWSVYPDDVHPVPGNPTVHSVLNYQDKIWIGTSRGVYYFDTILGWVPVNYGFPFGNVIKVFSLINNGSNVFAGTDRGIFKLVDTTWIEKNNGLPNTISYTLSFSDGYLYTGGGLLNSNVYISSNNGDNWNLSLTVASATSILTIASNIFVATYGDGVWRSTNYGNNWSQINNGLSISAYKIFSIAKNNQDLFVGTETSGVWKRPLSQIVTEVGENENIQPAYFSLGQNYPNPFNPSTKIIWQSPVGSRQTLKVYDVLGNEVTTLVDEYRDAGRYEVEFDASGLSSGVYFYKLTSGSFTETKKMLILK